MKSFPFWQWNVKVEPLPQWNVKLVLKRHNPVHYNLHYFENLTSLVKRCYVVKVIARWRLFSREKYSQKESVLRACIIVCFFSLISKHYKARARPACLQDPHWVLYISPHGVCGIVPPGKAWSKNLFVAFMYSSSIVSRYNNNYNNINRLGYRISFTCSILQ